MYRWNWGENTEKKKYFIIGKSQSCDLINVLFKNVVNSKHVQYTYWLFVEKNQFVDLNTLIH